MRNWGSWWIVALVMLALDWYVFSAFKAVTSHFSEKAKWVCYPLYWIVALGAIIIVAIFPYLQGANVSKFVRNYLFAIVVGLFFAKLIAAIFFALDDIRRLCIWLLGKIMPDTGARYTDEDGLIPRSTFLSWAGMALGGTLFGTLVYGFSNKYSYTIHKRTLKYPNLPEAFRGLKIVQISDIHSGSFQNKHAVAHGVDMILAENPDLVLFTGDLVNDRADEMNDYIDVFSRIKAPMGVYSTLGNHDYGDYVVWPTPAAKKANLDQLKQVHASMGWRLLMNEHVVFERNGEKIALLGIENWGAKGRFPKYGRMDMAHPGTETIPFKILLSHDPSHWDAEIRPKYPDIDLMLSGHTHGMQFGVELPHFKWSPVQWMYKQWAGLYEEGNQKLYVNRGYGFIGYPGRVGILPEITVLELV